MSTWEADALPLGNTRNSYGIICFTHFHVKKYDQNADGINSFLKVSIVSSLMKGSAALTQESEYRSCRSPCRSSGWFDRLTGYLSGVIIQVSHISGQAGIE